MTRSLFRDVLLAPVVMATLHLGAADSAAQAAASSQGTTGRAVFTPFTFNVALASGLEDLRATSRDTRTHSAGAPTRLYGQLGYSLRTQRSVFSTSAAATFAYHPQFSASSALGHGAAAQWDVVLGRRTRMEMKQHLSIAPLDLFSSAASEAGAIGVFPALTSDTALASGRMLNYAGSFALKRRLSQRSSASVTWTSAMSAVRRQDQQRSDIRTNMVAARIERKVSAFASLYAGYGFGVAQFGHGKAAAPAHWPAQQHDIAAGVDYARPLPFATDTTLRFAVGSTVLAADRAHRARLTTTAALERPLGRFWGARLEYTRPLQYVAGFAEPLLADTIRADVHGWMSRRIAASLSSGYSRGSVGIGRGGAQFGNYAFSARIGVHLQREWRLDVDAYHSSYHFGSAEALPSFIPEQFVRRGIRAGLAWSSPLGRR